MEIYYLVKYELWFFFRNLNIATNMGKSRALLNFFLLKSARETFLRRLTFFLPWNWCDLEKLRTKKIIIFEIKPWTEFFNENFEEIFIVPFSVAKLLSCTHEKAIYFSSDIVMFQNWLNYFLQITSSRKNAPEFFFFR